MSPRSLAVVGVVALGLVAAAVLVWLARDVPPALPEVAAEPRAAAASLAADAPAGAAQAPAAERGGVVAAAPVSARACTLYASAVWADGTPAPGIVLTLNHRGGGLPGHGIAELITGADGNAPPRELTPGPYSLRTVRADWTRFEAPFGEDVHVVVELPAGVDIVGRVVDGVGEPVAAAEIWMQGAGSRWNGGVVVGRSDAEGRFTVLSAEPGVSFGALAAGFEPSPLVDLDLVDTSSPPAEIELVVSAAGAAVSGIVLDPDGAPVEGAVVCVGKPPSPYLNMRMGSEGTVEAWSVPAVRTAADGRFRLQSLRPGPQPIAVAAEGFPLWDGEVAPTSSVEPQITVQLQAPITLQGTVRDPAGDAVAGAVVRVYPRALREDFLQGGQFDYEHVFGHPFAAADDAGRYRVTGIAPGSLHAYAVRGERRRRSGKAVVRAVLAREAAPGEVVAWDPVLDPGHTIRGVVLYRDGVPMGDVFVSLRNEETGVRCSIVNDSEGRFSFCNLEYAAYALSVQVWEPPPGSEPIGAQGVWPDGGELQLVADFDRPVDQTPGIVRGELRDAAGVMRPGEKLGALLRGERFSWRMVSKLEDNRFVFEDVDPGRYAAIALAGERVVATGAWFTLAPGQDYQLPPMVTEPPGAVRFRLRRGAGAEGSAPTVRVTPELAMDGVEVELGAQQAEHLVESLVPGNHRIRLHGEGLVLLSDSVAVASGQTTEHTLDLRAGVRCKLSVAYPAELELGALTVKVVGDRGEVFWDITERSTALPRPYLRTLTLPVGRFTLSAEGSAGPRGEQEFEVRSLDATPPTVRVLLRG